MTDTRVWRGQLVFLRNTIAKAEKELEELWDTERAITAGLDALDEARRGLLWALKMRLCEVILECPAGERIATYTPVTK